MRFYNGDVYNIGQIVNVNGIKTFIYIEGKWHYYSEHMMKEYDYDHEQLSQMIHDEWMTGSRRFQYLGNVFSYISPVET
jgi:hypothetical protein